MKRVWILAVMAMLFGASAAYAQKVTVDVDKTFDFANFKTFGWSDGQIAKNPIVSEMIKTAVEGELTARGLTRADEPDLKIAVMAAAGMDLQGVGPTWNNANYKSWGGYGNPNALMNISSGTMLIDLLESKNRFSVFRGVAKKTLNQGVSGNMEKDAKNVEKLIKTSVKKMFEKYPIKPRK